MVSAIKAFAGDIILAPLFFLFIVLAFFPFKFIPPEMHLIHTILYKLKKPHHTTRNKSTSSELLHAGFQSIPKLIDTKTDANNIERITVDDIDIPYTLSLQTNERKQFMPVQVEIDDKVIVNTSTARHGKVSCTIMIDSLGEKKIRVIKADGSAEENNSVIYDRRVIFEN